MTAKEKIVDRERLAAIADEARAAGKRIIWTSGCFDLLHAGHVALFGKSKQMGDLFVVGVNSDDSVRQLKGNGRPLVGQEERALLVAAMAAVDYVVIFPETRTNRCLEAIRPDVYVKGGDYDINSIDAGERELMLQLGGEIAFVPKVKGVSTTDLLSRIRQVREAL